MFDFEEHLEQLKNKRRKQRSKDIYFMRFDKKPRLTPQDGVYFKGYVAGFKNISKRNPYYDFPGQVTFRRSYERAWQRGYENGQKLRNTL